MVAIYVSLVVLVVAVVYIILRREKTMRELPRWRILANRYIGYVLAASALFYLVASILTAH